FTEYSWGSLNNAEDLQLAELNGNTLPDLLVGEQGRIRVYYDLGTSTQGSFTVNDIIVESATFSDVHSVDLDADGDQDVIATSQRYGQQGIYLRWWENDGTFEEQNMGGGEFRFDTGDLDGDGDLDIITGRSWYEQPGENLPSLDVTPTSLDFTWDGETVGPTETVTVSNVGGGTLDWNSTWFADWVSLTPSEGTLQAGNSVEVTVSIDEYPGDGAHATSAMVIATQGIPSSIMLDINLDAISGPSYTHETLSAAFAGASAVFASDLNGDGLLDILGASAAGGVAVWNQDPDLDMTWSENSVASHFSGGSGIYAADFNGDGHTDIVGAATEEDAIRWWENTVGTGANWTEYSVEGSYDGAKDVHARDLDGDGDMDIIAVAQLADDLTWWENNVGNGLSWTEHTVAGNLDGANSVYSEDVDGDGDFDLIASASGAQAVYWWENDNGNASSWTQHTVDAGFTPDPDDDSIHAADVDGDGDIDILGAAGLSNSITWWENTNGDGSSWSSRPVTTEFGGARAVYATDMDSDGDVDVLGSAFDDDRIAWWENTAGTGLSWEEHAVLNSLDGARGVFAADLDGDNDVDILSAGFEADEVVLLERPGIGPQFPEPFSLLAPSDLSVMNAPAVELEWEATTDPDDGDVVTYEVYVSTDENNFGDPVATGLMETNYEFIGEDDQLYWWTVKAVDTNSTGTWAEETWSFNIYIEEAPASFDLIGPADGSTLETDTPTLSWEASSDPDPDDTITYTLYWSVDDPDFGSPDSLTALTGTSYTFDGVDQLTGRARTPLDIDRSSDTRRRSVPDAVSKRRGSDVSSVRLSPRTSGRQATSDRSHARTSRAGEGPVRFERNTPDELDELPDDVVVYWYVIAHDGDTEGTLSTQNPEDDTGWSFSIDIPEAPEPFDLIGPSDGIVLDTEEAVLSWETTDDPDPGDEVSYDVYIWEAGGTMPGEATVEGIVSNSTIWTGGSDDTSYEWQVHARDEAGNETPASNGPRGFDIYVPDVPNAFSLLTPVDGTELEVTDPTVTWESTDDPDPDDTITYTLVWALDDDTFAAADSATGLEVTEYTFEDDVLAGRGPVTFRRGAAPAAKLAGNRGGRSAVVRNAAPEHGLDDELPDDVTVYWYVRAVDTNTDGTLSDQNPNDGTTWSFSVAVPQAPSAPGLVAPAEFAVIDELPLTFEWTASTDPDPEQTPTYTLEVADNPGFTDADTYDAGTDLSYEVATLEDDTAFWWRVLATDTNTAGTYSSTWEFSTAIPEEPSAPGLTSPDDGATIAELPVTFEWTASTDPDPGEEPTYTLEVADNDQFTDPMTFDAGTALTRDVDDLEDDTDYWWRVLATDDVLDGTYSATRSFSTTIPNAPTAPTLVSPDDAAVIEALPLTFEWTESTDPDGTTPGYMLEIADNPDFTDATEYDAGTDLSYEVTDLADDSEFWWRVKATDDNTDGTYSDERSFSTAIPEAPTAPGLTSPEDEVIVDALPLTFEWTASTDPDPEQSPTYSLEISMDEEFTDPDTYDAGTDLSFEVEELEDDTVYWWRVLATDTNTTGTYSEVRTFSVLLPEAPGAFSLESPDDGAHFVADDMPITFAWTESVDPDGDEVGYIVQLSTDPEFGDSTDVDAGTETSVEIGLDVIDESATWYWRVKAVDDSDLMLTTYSTDEWSITVDLPVPERERGIPTEWAVHSIYPNPFNPTVNIVVAVPELAQVNVTIYDVLGRQVAQLQNDVMQPGYHYLNWQATGKPSGMYFVRVSAESGFHQIRKMMFVK
ncbi:T9SS type A sorting domain-containing protein, partial [bacterium]|nr:T9SS type A sorting domain-containing protein [bacterium]